MSAASQAPGAETKAGDAAGGRRASAGPSKRANQGRGKRADGPMEIELVHARSSHLGWLIFGVLVGGLLLWKLAFIGKLVGFILLVVGGIAGRSFLLTMINAPGTFRLDDDKLEMPDGLCRGKTVTVEVDKVRHAFFLRRAVPWTRAGPVLIIEAGDHALAYPRDWFSSDADQQRLLEALTPHTRDKGDRTAAK